VIVFLLDGRVRKIESVTAVFEFLDFKKSYISHISHDLHTPLHAATLGLNMAITRMNKHKEDHGVDHELIETLSGIRLACNAAVNSLNEFLFSGQGESGILELCLETTPVVDYLSINIDMLSEQAIAKRVALDVLFHVDAAVFAMHPTAVPLRSDDCFSIDRYKMDQVLQKLVNNAIKFSQEDSTITIRAYFCSSIADTPTVSSMNDIHSVLVHRNNDDENVLMIESGDILLHRVSSNTLTEGAVGDAGSQIDGPASSSRSHISPRPDDIVGYVVVTVTDTGPGINDDKKKYLFRGVTDRHNHHNDTENEDQSSLDSGKSGSGFGLFISRCIVDLHGGTYPPSSYYLSIIRHSYYS